MAEPQRWDPPELAERVDQLKAISANTEVYDSRVPWLLARGKGLGASDAAVILGESGFKSAFALYTERKTEDVVYDAEEPLLFEVARFLEPKVLELYTREIEECTMHVDLGPWSLVRHPSHSWLSCTPDYLVYREDKGWGCLEVKTAHIMTKAEWDDEPPTSHQIQLQHQLMVTGLDWGVVAALIGHHLFKLKHFERHQPFIDNVLFPKLEEFWQRIQDGNPPEIDGSDSSTAALRSLYPHEVTGKFVVLPSEAVDYDTRRQELKAQIKELESEEKGLTNKLKALLGDAEIGDLLHCQFESRLVKVAEQVRKAYEFRNFTRKAKKEA